VAETWLEALVPEWWLEAALEVLVVERRLEFGLVESALPLLRLLEPSTLSPPLAKGKITFQLLCSPSKTSF